ncbi:hypothetical protein L2216_18325, partial [Xanthomonas perforans]|nr:hypothetical protein [Xanthomonas perforans]
MIVQLQTAAVKEYRRQPLRYLEFHLSSRTIPNESSGRRIDAAIEFHCGNDLSCRQKIGASREKLAQLPTRSPRTAQAITYRSIASGARMTTAASVTYDGYREMPSRRAPSTDTRVTVDSNFSFLQEHDPV